MSLNPLHYVILALTTALIGMGVELWSTTTEYQEKITRLRGEHAMRESKLQGDLIQTGNKLAITKGELSVLGVTVSELTKQIEDVSVDAERVATENKKWKNKPDGERYKRLYDKLKLSNLHTTKHTLPGTLKPKAEALGNIMNTKQKGEVNEKDECTRYKDVANAFDGFDPNRLFQR